MQTEPVALRGAFVGLAGGEAAQQAGQPSQGTIMRHSNECTRPSLWNERLRPALALHRIGIQVPLHEVMLRCNLQMSGGPGARVPRPEMESGVQESDSVLLLLAVS